MRFGSMHAHASDLRMLNQLRALFAGDGLIPRLDVDVDVENGVVEVLGVIPDEREHDMLLRRVVVAAGSKPVIDHLIVTKRLRPNRNRRHASSPAKRR